MYKKFSQFMLKKYESQDYLTRRKANLMMFIPILLVSVLLIGTIASFAVSMSRVLQFMQASIPVLIVSILTSYLLKKGRLQFSANLFVCFCSVIVIITLMMKPPHLGYVTLIYFMFICLLFGALFTSKLITTLILICFVAADVVYYVIHSGTLQGIIAETFKTGLIDSIATLILMYFIAMLTISMLQNALALINEEKEKNLKHYMEMSKIHTTIHKSTNNLTHLAEEMSSTAAVFSTNLQGQASSLNEITATSEEVASSLQEINNNTEDQYQLFVQLTDRISNLANEIDLLKNGSGEVSRTFGEILKSAQSGEKFIVSIDKSSKELLESSHKLSSIMEMIEDIFDKIKLLALNASIEAARAGEQGLGFGVVAKEVNKLSEESMSSLKEINLLIQANMQRAEEGNANIIKTISLFREIVTIVKKLEVTSDSIFKHISNQEEIKEDIHGRINNVKQRAEDIRDSTQSLDKVTSEVSSSIANINSLILSNADGSRELASNAEKVSQMAEDLHSLIQEDDSTEA